MLKRFALLMLVLLGVTQIAPQPPAQAAPISIDKASPFGLVTTLANRIREDELGKAITLLKEAGVQWAREEIFWDRLQPQRGGPYLWGGPGGGMYNYDAAIAGLQGASINILGQLDYNPAWFKSQNPPLDAWIQDWGDYVYNTVARYGRDRGAIKHWEIWNEENLRNFGYENGIYTVKDYVRVLQVARAAAHAADPEAVIVLGGVAAIWSDARDHEYDVLTYLQLLHDAGGWDSFDILAIHPYRPSAPETPTWRRDDAFDLDAELSAVDAINQRFGAKPIWLTEIGWPSYPGHAGVSPDDQAAYLVRMYVLALNHPAVQRIFWYDFRDDTAPTALYHEPVFNDTEPEFHFGLLRRQFPLNLGAADLRKPAFQAYRTLREVLGGLHPTGGTRSADNVLTYRFDGNGRAALVVWRLGDSPTVQVQCGCANAAVRSLSGKLLALVNTDGALNLRLPTPGQPVFVEWGADRRPAGPFFPATGHRIAQPFLSYWQSHGGLEQFGYPLTGLLTEPDPQTGAGRLVQYFERNRLEIELAQAGNAGAVQLGRLGDELLRQRGIDWMTLPTKSEAPPECTYVPVTQHQLCEPFKSYWEQHGGLELHGLPLSEAFDENGFLVQYFERSRFEYHPEHAATPFAVQLSLLGRDLYTRWGQWP